MTDARRKGTAVICAIALGFVSLSCGGCALYHSLGTGVRYDPPQEQPAYKSKQVHDMLIEVTTNASGAVTQVQFKRSSGSPDLDAYVADSIRSDWAGGPSRRSVAELTYSGEKGFSTPKIITTEPVP